MEVKVVISHETAIAAGHARSGIFQLHVTDEFVAELSEAEREELICLVRNSTDASLWNQAGIAIACESIERPDLPALKSLIQRRIFARDAANARLEADALRKASEKEETAIKAVQAWLAKDPESKLLGRAPNVSVMGVSVWPYEGIPPVVRDAYEMHRAHLQGIANQRNAEAAREAAEREATERRECAEQRANIKAWIAKHGSASMQAREAEKLLPEKELLHAVREWLFAPLADFARYERLDDGDARHADDCYTGAPIAYQTEDADELTEPEYERLDVLRDAARRLAEPAEVQAREHRVMCRHQNCPAETLRRSVLVSIDWNGYPLSREYALTAPGEDSYID
jgi:hypothetical protein